MSHNVARVVWSRIICMWFGNREMCLWFFFKSIHRTNISIKQFGSLNLIKYPYCKIFVNWLINLVVCILCGKINFDGIAVMIIFLITAMRNNQDGIEKRSGKFEIPVEGSEWKFFKLTPFRTENKLFFLALSQILEFHKL